MALDFLLAPAGRLFAVVAATVAIYAYLVALLRLTGNRTLASLRAYDFVVVIAIGSLVASAAVSGTPVAESAVAVTVLVLLQLGLSALTRRSRRVQRLAVSPPTLLFFDGRFCEPGMAKARLSEEELRLAVRQEGHSSLERVFAVILEPNGRLAVVMRRESGKGRDALDGVPGLDG